MSTPSAELLGAVDADLHGKVLAAIRRGTAATRTSGIGETAVGGAFIFGAAPIAASFAVGAKYSLDHHPQGEHGGPLLLFGAATMILLSPLSIPAAAGLVIPGAVVGAAKGAHDAIKRRNALPEAQEALREVHRRLRSCYDILWEAAEKDPPADSPAADNTAEVYDALHERLDAVIGGKMVSYVHFSVGRVLPDDAHPRLVELLTKLARWERFDMDDMLLEACYLFLEGTRTPDPLARLTVVGTAYYFAKQLEGGVRHTLRDIVDPYPSH